MSILPSFIRHLKHLRVFPTVPDQNDQASEAGQSLIEFVFLLAVIMTMSMLTMRGMNRYIGEAWRFIVTQVVGPYGSVSL